MNYLGSRHQGQQQGLVAHGVGAWEVLWEVLWFPRCNLRKMHPPQGCNLGVAVGNLGVGRGGGQ